MCKPESFFAFSEPKRIQHFSPEKNEECFGCYTNAYVKYRRRRNYTLHVFKPYTYILSVPFQETTETVSQTEKNITYHHNHGTYIKVVWEGAQSLMLAESLGFMASFSCNGLTCNIVCSHIMCIYKGS